MFDKYGLMDTIKLSKFFIFDSQIKSMLNLWHHEKPLSNSASPDVMGRHIFSFEHSNLNIYKNLF